MFIEYNRLLPYAKLSKFAINIHNYIFGLNNYLYTIISLSNKASIE